MKEQIKTARLELSGEFAGIWMEIRKNPPMRVYENFASGELARVLAALATITRSSNLTDEADKPIDLGTVDGWREVSSELVGEVALQIKAALESPKASSNGSATPSSPVVVPSPAPTT